MVGEKIKLAEEAISEVLFAVTHLESGSKGSKSVLRLESHHMHVIHRPKFIIKIGEYFFPRLTDL
jgi:hypothetical protein